MAKSAKTTSTAILGTQLVDLREEGGTEPGLVRCWGGGSVFKKEKGETLFRVQKGKMQILSRAVCVSGYFGQNCDMCPNYKLHVTFQAKGAPDDSSP